MEQHQATNRERHTLFRQQILVRIFSRLPLTFLAQKMETHPHEKESTLGNFKDVHKQDVEQHPEDVFVLPQILKQN